MKTLSVLLACATLVATQAHGQSGPSTISFGGSSTFSGDDAGRRSRKFDLGKDFSEWLDRKPDVGVTPSKRGLQPLAKDGPLIDQLQSGTFVPLDVIRTKIKDASALRQLRNPQPATVDLKKLGLGTPTRAVDLYSLYSGDQFHGIVTRPPHMSPNDLYASLSKKGKNVVPKVVEFGGKIVSSLNQIILVALTQICTTAPRPSELNLSVKGGLGIFVSLAGEVSVKIDLNTSCAALHDLRSVAKVQEK